jgi:hypothetical protein
MGSSKPSVCTDTRTPHSRAVFPTVYLSKSWLLTRLAARERLAFVRLSAAKSAGRDTKRSPSPPSSGWGQFVRRIVVNSLPTPHLRPAILPALPHPGSPPPALILAPDPSKRRSNRPCPCHRRHARPNLGPRPPGTRQSAACFPHRRPRRHHVIDHQHQSPAAFRREPRHPTTRQPHRSRHVSAT